MLFRSQLDSDIQRMPDMTSRYITPERGGILQYNANTDQSISQSPTWIQDTRRKNRFEQFREQSATQFRNLEIMILREIEKDPVKRADQTYTFDTELNQINKVLPAIEIRRIDRGFDIFSKSTGQKINNTEISSGESELIALAIEVLVFSRQTEGQQKALLLDEPDVHLHPDLQQRFIHFLEKIAEDTDFRVVIATHSTAIVSSFQNKADLQIVLLSINQTEEQKVFQYDSKADALLPIFGAHPLSQHFNNSPTLLIEGHDDKRVFDQIVRSSNGKFIFSPCVVNGVGELTEWEQWLCDYLPSIYDDPIAYSLRDLDQSAQTQIDNLGVVIRARLNCRAIENILLCDEVLDKHGISSESFSSRIDSFIKAHADHQYTPDLQGLKESFVNRRTYDVKNIRNILVALLGSNKPWEVIVGQTIAERLEVSQRQELNSIAFYLGEDTLMKIFKI